MKEIMVAIDGSDGSRAAIDEAVELAGPLGAHITFASVRKAPSSLLGTPNYECRLARDLGVARATVDSALKQAREAGVEARGEVLEGNAVDEILSFADNCGADLIVMGSRGHGALAGALLGSVSSGVVQHANVPVLVAKQAPRASAASRLANGPGNRGHRPADRRGVRDGSCDGAGRDSRLLPRLAGRALAPGPPRHCDRRDDGGVRARPAEARAGGRRNAGDRSRARRRRGPAGSGAPDPGGPRRPCRQAPRSGRPHLRSRLRRAPRAQPSRGPGDRHRVRLRPSRSEPLRHPRDRSSEHSGGHERRDPDGRGRLQPHSSSSGPRC